MGVIAFLGSLFYKKEETIYELIEKVEPVSLRKEIEIINSRIIEIRKVKNRISGGKSFSNQLKYLERQSPDEFRKIWLELFPLIINLNNDLKSLLVKISNSKNINVSREVLDYLNLARIEFEQDTRITNNAMLSDERMAA